MPARPHEHPPDAPPSSPARPLTCPRCAYDLSGPVPTWTTACPTTGTCPECGLAFAWSDIFDPLRDTPPWLFEHAPRRRAPIAYLSTSLRTLLPWRFWRDVKMGFPLRRVRLALMVGIPLALAYLVPVLAFVAIRLFVWGPATGRFWPRRNIANVSFSFRLDFLPILRWPESIPETNSIALLLGVWFVTGLLIPLAFLTLLDTLGRVQARPAHFVRAAAYNLMPLLTVTLLWIVVTMAAVVAREHLWNGNFFTYRNRAVAGFDWGAWIWHISHGQVLWPLLWPIVLVLQWWCTCRFYLRIPHAFAVALLLVLLAILATPILTFPLFREVFDRLLQYTL